MVRGICFLQLWIIWELSIRWQFFVLFCSPFKKYLYISYEEYSRTTRSEAITRISLLWAQHVKCRNWNWLRRKTTFLSFSQPTNLYPVDFKKKDMGGGLWSTYVCIDHEIIFSVVSLSATTHSTTTSRCPHGFRARTSQELNLAQQWKDPHFQFYHCIQPVWARWQPLLLKEFDISLSKGHKPFQIMLLGWHNSREEDMWCTYVLPIY